MPFEVLETETRDNMPPLASISYLRNVRKGREMDRGKIKPKLTVTVPTVVVISRKKRFQIFVGTGMDAGKVRLVGTDEMKKGAKATDFKNHLIIRFGHVPALGDEIFDSEKCPIDRINDDTYEITVKELFKEAAIATLDAKRKATTVAA